jgi:transcription antitermination factor NusG
MLWFAVECRPQKEAYANDHLRKQNFETFFPHTSRWVGLTTSRSRLVKRAWLTRYLFVHTDRALLYRVLLSPGVTSLVCGAGESPVPIPERIITELQDEADPLGEILRSGLAAPRVFKPKAHDRVRIGEGSPLWGFYATVSDVFSDALMVELDRAISGTTKVQVPMQHIEEVMRA